MIKRKRVLGTNDAFRLGDWVDACYFGDCKWWEWNKMEFRKYKGLKMTSCQRLYHIPFLHTWKRDKPRGITERPGYISWNACTGLSAINIAYNFGAKRVILIGFDMGPMEEKVDGDIKKTYHWHNYHKTASPKGNYKGRYLLCIPSIVKDAKKLGLEILNASPHTNIREALIPRVKLEEVV